MKKRLLRFLLGISYIGLMTALLTIYAQNIAGKAERTFAILGTLALSIPAVIVLILYIRLKNREEAAPKEARTPDSETTHAKFEAAEVKHAEIEQMEQMEDLEERIRPFSLSKRETEVAWLLYRGYTNRQIAEELYIAETTVKKHVTHIYEKMQVSGRKEYKEKLRKGSITKEDVT